MVERSDTTGIERASVCSIPAGSQRTGAGIPPGCETFITPSSGGGAALTTGCACETSTTPNTDSIPEGSQTDALSSLRDERDGGDGEPVVALRLPPANGSNPFGVDGGAQWRGPPDSFTPEIGDTENKPLTHARLQSLLKTDGYQIITASEVGDPSQPKARGWVETKLIPALTPK